MRWRERFSEKGYDPDLVEMEIHNGIRWMSLNFSPYRLGARTLSDETQTKNRLSSSSSMFDGEWIFHTTKSNVSETIEVYVSGETPAETNIKAAELIEAFEQPMYNVRFRIDDYQETWRCFEADYSINRSHTMLHNNKIVVTFSVPRLPNVQRDVAI